jgi:hypothetical protein
MYVIQSNQFPLQHSNIIESSPQECGFAHVAGLVEWHHTCVRIYLRSFAGKHTHTPHLSRHGWGRPWLAPFQSHFRVFSPNLFIANFFS